MRLPSIKTLSRIFGDNAKQARAILELSQTGGKLSEFSDVVALRQESMQPPTIRAVKLCALNQLGEFFGVEYIPTIRPSECDRDMESAEYLNSGDTYADTLIYWRGSYRVQSVGDFIERSRVSFV